MGEGGAMRLWMDRGCAVEKVRGQLTDELYALLVLT